MQKKKFRRSKAYEKNEILVIDGVVFDHDVQPNRG